MAVCTFFGHRDTPERIEPFLRTVLTDLIENRCVDMFYVGDTGRFDTTVRKTLKALLLEYPHIHYAVVLAYLPCKSDLPVEEYADTVYPAELENVPLRYAIPRRNRWMLDKADIVVTYVQHLGGGAAQCKELAEKKGKIIFNIAEMSLEQK